MSITARDDQAMAGIAKIASNNYQFAMRVARIHRFDNEKSKKECIDGLSYPQVKNHMTTWLRIFL